jgi:hypothetical protein
MLTAEKLTLAKKEMEVMIGNSSQLQLTATYRDGHTANVASQAHYSISNTSAVEISGGRISGLSEGSAKVEVSYTDPMGNELTESFTVRSSFFPFSKEFVKTDFFGNGTYNERTHSFKPSQWGQMGWEYPSGADMSDYKYLVIKLGTTSSNSHLNIFTENSIWSPCYSTADFSTKKQIVVNLSTAKYTNDSNKKGQPLDTKNIHIVAFWGNGNQSIRVNDMYLTNNSDYSPMTDVKGITANQPSKQVNVYSLSGQLVRQQADQQKAVQGLPAGIYIVDGRKVFVK